MRVTDEGLGWSLVATTVRQREICTLFERLFLLFSLVLYSNPSNVYKLGEGI
jgi:hypothetical protein